MKRCLVVFALVFSMICTACGVSPTPDPFILTPPAISLNLTKAGCPSIEIQPGMQIAWTNLDNVDRLLIVERVDEQGVVMDSGGTSLLQPGTTFMITLLEEGQYTYYCSIDRKEFGTINVVPNVSVSTNAHSTSESSTPECVENVIPPTIIEIQPARPSAGSEITVMGSGGYIQDSCGGVNESARSFPLYLDNEPAADLQCYVNHCEAKLRLGDTLADGAHCLSMQKDVCEVEFRVAGQSPAPSTLEINGQMQTAQVGSYCWDYTDENGKPVGGACMDSIGISTPIKPIPAEEMITAQLSLPYEAPPDRLSLLVFPASSENEIPLEEGADLRLWSYTEGIIHELDLQPRQEVKIELEPGLYVFNVSAGWDDKGEVMYGFLVEVQRTQ